MSPATSGPPSGQRVDSAGDREVVARQIGRQPRGTWHTGARCSHGFPVVIVVAPHLGSGGRFPTTFWLTCPWLVEAVSDLESDGAAARWTAELARDDRLSDAAVAADRAYREARAVLAGGSDPCRTVGTAGQADPLVVKCVHARVAAFLSGVPDPVGDRTLADLVSGGLSAECPDARCASA